MNEKPFQPPSAEKQYQMEKNEVLAMRFAQDPVQYVAGLRHSLQFTKDYNPADWCNKTIEYCKQLIETIRSQGFPTEQPELQKYLSATSTYEEMRALFTILKAAGVEKGELSVWIDESLKPFNMEDVDYQKHCRVAMRTVYDE